MGGDGGSGRGTNADTPSCTTNTPARSLDVVMVWFGIAIGGAKRGAYYNYSCNFEITITTVAANYDVLQYAELAPLQCAKRALERAVARTPATTGPTATRSRRAPRRTAARARCRTGSSA